MPVGASMGQTDATKAMEERSSSSARYGMNFSYADNIAGEAEPCSSLMTNRSSPARERSGLEILEDLPDVGGPSSCRSRRRSHRGIASIVKRKAQSGSAESRRSGPLCVSVVEEEENRRAKVLPTLADGIAIRRVGRFLSISVIRSIRW